MLKKIISFIDNFIDNLLFSDLNYSISWSDAKAYNWKLETLAHELGHSIISEHCKCPVYKMEIGAEKGLVYSPNIPIKDIHNDEELCLSICLNSAVSVAGGVLEKIIHPKVKDIGMIKDIDRIIMLYRIIEPDVKDYCYIINYLEKFIYNIYDSKNNYVVSDILKYNNDIISKHFEFYSEFSNFCTFFKLLIKFCICLFEHYESKYITLYNKIKKHLTFDFEMNIFDADSLPIDFIKFEFSGNNYKEINNGI